MTDEINVTAAPEESKAVETREICGIKVPVDCIVTDSEIEGFSELVSKMNRIEVNHYIERFNNDMARSVNYESIVTSSKDTLQSFKELGEVFKEAQRDDVASKLQFQRCIDEVENAINTEDEEDLDFAEVKKSIAEYQQRINVGLEILKKHYAELRSDGDNYDLVDDIIDTLNKNILALNSSENLNREYYKKGMQTVIDEIQKSESKILNPYDRMAARLNNPKRTKEILEFVFKNPDKVKKEILSVSFTEEMLQQLTAFIVTECNYYNYLHADSSETPKSYEYYKEMTNSYCKKGVCKFYGSCMSLCGNTLKNVYQFLCTVFMYQVSKISKTETKRVNYLSLIFKCYVLQVVEIYSKTKKRIEFKDTTVEVYPNKTEEFKDILAIFESRSKLNPESDIGKISALRQQMFMNYDKVFSSYLSSLK